MMLGHLLITQIRINSKCIKGLNVRLETINTLEENIGSKVLDIAGRNFFIGYTSPGEGNKRKKNKQMRLRQTKSFFTAKEIINKIKRQLTE